jgi:hypothetical protein
VFGKLVTVLVRPDRFYEDWEPTGRDSVAAVGVVGVVTLASLVPAFLSIDGRGEFGGGGNVAFAAGEATVEVPVALVEALATGLLLPVVLWPFYAGLLALFAAPESGFRDLFYRAGWGFVPHAVASLATLVATVVVLETAPGATVRTAIIGVAGHSFVQFAEPRPVARVARLVGHACTVWGGVVWTAALVVGYGVDRRRAATVAGGLVALLLFFSTIGIA